MTVIDPFLAPRGTGRIFTSIFVPIDIRSLSEDVCFNKRPDIESDPVV
jgi:hypothetical protein